MAALAATVAVVTLAATPGVAAAGKPPKDGGGSTPSGAICDLVDSSMTLDEINTAIGSAAVHNLKGKSSITGDGVSVAVIDTGISPVEGLDDNVVNGPDLSFDGVHENLRSADLHGHGTNMAAIIGADSREFGSGVAPGSQLVDVKVGAGDGAVDVSQVIAGIDWVVQNRDAAGMNIRVINLAYDTDADVDVWTDPLVQAVENAWRHGIVVVVAGGNDGRGVHRLGNPAISPYVIAVGAAELKSGSWMVPTYSSTGDGVRNPDIVAPGSEVLSAGVPGSYLATTHTGATCLEGEDLYLRGSGTSQAAAVVSGAVALLLDQRPNLTPDQVKYLLTSTADKLYSGNGLVAANRQGHGMIDLTGAFAASTPSVLQAKQLFMPSNGLGSLDASRGSMFVGPSDDQLRGEVTAFGEGWNGFAHGTAQLFDSTWTNQTFDGTGWVSGTWMGSTWSGSTWSGSTWSGSTWSGSTWSGSTWSGSTWSGSTWSGSTWSGSTWSGSTWM